MAKQAVVTQNFHKLCEAIDRSYYQQLDEGMKDLPNKGETVKKYCGSGHGGYALYIYEKNAPEKPYLTAIQPYMKW